MLSKYISDNKYDLYHARYGRGAVIILIDKSTCNRKPGGIKSDLHVASIFSSKAQELGDGRQLLDPIESIEIKDDLIIIDVKFERHYKSNPSYNPINATIRRIIPKDQVTLEIVTKN